MRSHGPFVTLAAAATLYAVLAGAATGAGVEDEDGADRIPVADRGFFLGDFLIKDLRPVEGAKSTLSFSLHAHVVGSEVERFEGYYRNRVHRVRNQVIISSRLAEPADFRDPELRRFRRRLLLRLRRAVPELKLTAVYFSDFHYAVD